MDFLLEFLFISAMKEINGRFLARIPLHEQDEGDYKWIPYSVSSS
ncbi:hypothetical protein [Fredinandcohnia onubensis]|nr:hypothetical protein [Fredinandcohnia onubensis]